MKSHINIPKPTAQSFIAGAPDAQPAKKDDAADELQKQISLKLPTALLARVDAAAARFNTSRAGYIKMTLSRAVEVDAP
jgi:hypothetical protein